MAEEIVKTLRIDTSDSQETVKSLRNEIKDLRDNILNLEKGTDEYDKAVKELQDDQKRLDDVMSLTKKTATALDGSYDALVQKMSALKKEWRATNDEAKRDELGKQIASINDELKEMDASIGNYQRNVGSYKESIISAYDEINQKISEYQNIAAQAYQTGDVDAYNEAIKELGANQGILDQITKDSEFANGSLEKKMQNLNNVAQGVAGGFAAVQGIMALTGNESKDFEKTMTKLGGAMAIVQGLQGVQGFVGGLKGMRIALKASCAGLSGFKKALISTGIGAIVVLVGTLVANWDDLTKAIEKSVGSLDKFKEAFAGIKNAVGNFFESIFKAIGKALKGDFKEAGELMKKSVQFSAAYQEGAEKKSVEIAENASLERAKISAKESEDYVADQEAKLGADWKWTQDGIKAYRNMYSQRMAMYAKDTDEYKKAQRDKWAFERELKEKMQPDVGKLADDIANGISIEDDDIKVDDKISLEDNSGKASANAKAKINSKERAYRKAQNDLILMDSEERAKKEIELEQKLQSDKLAIIENAMKDALANGDLEGWAELSNQKADLEIEIEKSKNEQLKQLRDEDLENQKEKKEQEMEITMSSLDTISNALSAVADLYQTQAEAKVKSGKMTESQYKNEMKKVKGIQIAQATISTLTGAIDAYMSMAKIPIVGPALGAVAAATVTAAGVAQIMKIKNTDVSGGSVPSLGGGVGSVSPDTAIVNQTFTPRETHQLTGRNEVEELNQSQRVYILESDIQASNKRVEIRESEASF